MLGYHGNGLCLGYAWVGFIRFAVFHTLRYKIASYSSLCRSSHFVHTLTGILALAAMQRQPSNIIDFGPVNAGLSVDIAHYVRLVMASRVTVGFGQLCPAQGARPLASCCCFKG